MKTNEHPRQRYSREHQSRGEARRAMTLQDALQKHELDVAAFEISDAGEQFKNLKKWLDQVDEPDRENADRLLKAAGRKRVLLAQKRGAR